VSDLYPSRELTDQALDEEIQLLGELVLAASGMTRHLTPEEVDQTLGVHLAAASEHPHPPVRRRRAKRVAGSSPDGEGERSG
jgi:hypothetical protein